MKVAVLGASPNPERYSNRAIRMLSEYDHDVIPVNPGYEEIEGIPTVKGIESLEPGTVHTVTMYVGAERSDPLVDALIALNPQRVIFNPGAENPRLAEALEGAGVESIEACTLVMLRAGSF